MVLFLQQFCSCRLKPHLIKTFKGVLQSLIRIIDKQLLVLRMIQVCVLCPLTL